METARLYAGKMAGRIHEYVVKANLPGVDKKDIDIQLTENVLRVKGFYSQNNEEKGERYLLQERRMGSFSRSIAFNEELAPDEYSEDPDMLHAIVSTAKFADLGIQDIKFEINNIDITRLSDIPDEMDEDTKNNIVTALAKLKEALESAPNDAEGKLRVSEIKATSFHIGQSKKGEDTTYPLSFSDESDGTRRLMALAPAIERTLRNGGVFVVDELEREIHPLLMEYIINRYQNKENNQNQAQLVFTTHSTELMSLELLRRDQINFVDKDRKTGASELYSMKEFSPRKDENIHKGYLLGKYGAVPRIEEV